MARALQKYLARWAEPQAGLAEQLTRSFAFGLAIPALAEGVGLVETLRTVTLDRGAPLVVAVVNRGQDATAEQVALHRETVEAISRAWPVERALDDSATLHPFGEGALITLDLVLPRKRAGVGLARKIGHDLLLAAWSRDQLGSNWLYSTDADVSIPPDFFDPPGRNVPSASALLQPFTHVPVEAWLADATARYEARLRHHVLGLRWAGSAYAFHNIGSTIACNARSYAQVRGFPIRSAAEDFYLLSKLSKVGPVIRRQGQPLEIAGRCSWRVPFGTGAAISKAVSDDAAGPPLCYHPGVFVLLRHALEAMHAAVEQGRPFEDLVDETHVHHSGIWRRGLAQRPISKLVDQVNSSGLPAERKHRRLQDGFDALQTLKLMHAFRAEGLPDCGVESALADSPFCPDPPGSIDATCAYLAALEDA